MLDTTVTYLLGCGVGLAACVLLVLMWQVVREVFRD